MMVPFPLGLCPYYKSATPSLGECGSQIKINAKQKFKDGLER